MVDLSTHQLKAIRDLSNGKILYGGVGCGKSRISLAYFMLKVAQGPLNINGNWVNEDFKTRMPLYIITTARKRDSGEWLDELAPFSLMEGDTGGILERPVVVDSWNNISKYADVRDSMFILDEQRLVGSGKWVQSFLKIARKNQWIILSGTPGDDWTDYIPTFVANRFYKNRTHFLREHAVYSRFANYPKIERWVDTDRLNANRDRVLVHVDYSTHTTRHVLTTPTKIDDELYSKVRKERWNPWEDRPIQDAGELYRLMRRVSNQDPSRTEQIGEILEKTPRLIVFYNFDYELELLRWFCKAVGATYAEWNGHVHMEVPGTDSWVYLVQYTAGSEAWNCIVTDSVVFYSLPYSYKVFEQCMGRIDRMNTPYLDLYYYVLRNNSEIDRMIWKALVRKKSFNESAYIKKLGKEFENEHHGDV